MRPPHSHALARRDRPVVALLRRHWRKFGAFGTIGFTVFLAGLALQVALVRLAGMGNVTSYVIKTLASVQLSLLLNRYLTWRDRDIPMIRAAALFNVQQLTIQGIGVAAYAGLVRLGVGYILANVAITAILTPFGYVASHVWSLASRRSTRLADGIVHHSNASTPSTPVVRITHTRARTTPTPAPTTPTPPPITPTPAPRSFRGTGTRRSRGLRPYSGTRSSRAGPGAAQPLGAA